MKDLEEYYLYIGTMLTIDPDRNGDHSKMFAVCEKISENSLPLPTGSIIKIDEKNFERLKNKKFIYQKGTSREQIAKELELEEFLI